VLHVWAEGVKVQPRAPQQFANVGNLLTNDYSGMMAARGFPLAFESLVVSDVEREDGATLLRCVFELHLVRKSLIISPGFLAAFCVIATIA